MGKKIAIVGCADSKNLAPYKDETWEIWGVNNLYLQCPRWTRWFEIHLIETQDNITYTRRYQHEWRNKTVADYLKDLASLNCPVYMQRPWPVIPQSIAYPLQDVLLRFPRRYFTNTISYMLALAIMEQPDAIGIWGVDMAVGTEYNHQRPSCEYFCGIIDGMKIPLIVPNEADLLKTRFLYGFEEPKQSAWEMKVRKMVVDMTNRMNQVRNQKKEAEYKEQQFLGAINAVQEFNKIWG